MGQEKNLIGLEMGRHWDPWQNRYKMTSLLYLLYD